MTEAIDGADTADQGVTVLRSKMRRRRKREARRLNHSATLSRSYSGDGSSFNDSLSAITPETQDAKQDDLDIELEGKSAVDNWELDQKPESDQTFAVPATPPQTPITPIKTPVRVPTPNEAQKFAKIAFTTDMSDELEKSDEFGPVDGAGDSLAALQKELLASDEHHQAEQVDDSVPVEDDASNDNDEEEEKREHSSDTESQVGFSIFNDLE